MKKAAALKKAQKLKAAMKMHNDFHGWTRNAGPPYSILVINHLPSDMRKDYLPGTQSTPQELLYLIGNTALKVSGESQWNSKKALLKLGEITLREGLAVCTYLAAAALYLLSLRDSFPLRIEFVSDTKTQIPHSFLIVGRDPNSDLNALSTWGDDAFVIDPWAAMNDPEKIIWDPPVTNVFASGLQYTIQLMQAWEPWGGAEQVSATLPIVISNSNSTSTAPVPKPPSSGTGSDPFADLGGLVESLKSSIKKESKG
jgi:hypothetical protein